MGWSDFFPSPVEMWEATRPVDTITVRVGETVEIPVYGVAMAPSSSFVWGTGYYQVSQDIEDETLIASGLPEEALWERSALHHGGRVVTWVPQPEDAGTTQTWTFELNGSVSFDDGTVRGFHQTQTLDVHVRGLSLEVDVTPVAQGQTGVTYAAYASVPEGAQIDPPSMDHLVDVETGEYPLNPIFPFQVMNDFVEEWQSEAQERYGFRFHISRLDDPWSPAPTGHKSWRYFVDVKPPRYDGMADLAAAQAED
jgi:hypothetical protein